MRSETFLAAACLLGLAASCKKDGDVPARAKCGYHSDCANDGVCYGGECYGTATCIERAQCEQVPVCADHRCFCHPDVKRCYPVCLTDNDCPTDGHCVDGVCTAYPLVFDGALPPSGARGPLKVGLARIELDFPMGVSLAGYGSRRGPRTPYQHSLGGSNAWFDKPDVRAIAFDDGEEMFVLVRLPMGWSTDEMHTAMARKIQDRIGLNLLDHIVTSATHSHAQPAGFWHLVKGFGFGYFGYDEFNYEVFDRLTTSFAEAVIMALDDMQPAKVGHIVVDPFDPDDLINRDRRPENNGLPGYIGKDNRMVLVRVDDMSGTPIAVLTNFGLHGTVFDYDNPIITGDAPGGVEVELTLRASEKYGQPVLGFFLNGNGGDISPGGDRYGHKLAEQMQLVGVEAWKVMDPKLDEITTREDAEISVVQGRFSISHEKLGYAPGEYFDSDVSCENSASYFRYGAFQCVNGHFHDEDPNTKFVDGDLDCVFSVECLTSGFPVPQFTKSHLAAARIGDLVFSTVPGEPLTQYGRDIASRIEAELPGVDAAVLGYSMDDFRYIMNADDWFQGGYEPSFGIWGWQTGPFFADRLLEFAKLLPLAPADRVIDDENMKPMHWEDPPEDRVPVPFNDTEGDPAEVLVEVPAAIERMDIVDFAWRGGHPGLDRPHIVLEVETNGAFAEVRRAGGLLYDDAYFEMLVHYDGTCSRSNCTEHAWRVTWQERRTFPLGRYRFHVTGRAQVNGAITDYETTSQPFDLGPATGLSIYDLRAAGDQIEGRIVDPPAVVFVPDGDRLVLKEDAGHLLLSETVPSELGVPLPEGMTLTASGTIRSAGSPDLPIAGSPSMSTIVEPRRQVVAYAADGTPELRDAGSRPTTRFAVDGLAGAPPGDYVVTLTLTDQLGNSGTITATITR
jgi:neutral ceramidase